MYSFVFIFFTLGPLCLVITHIFLTSNIKLLFVYLSLSRLLMKGVNSKVVLCVLLNSTWNPFAFTPYVVFLSEMCINSIKGKVLMIVFSNYFFVFTVFAVSFPKKIIMSDHCRILLC